MAEKATSSHEQKSSGDWLESKLIRNLVFFGSGLAAAATAVSSIWQEFYDEIKGLEPFQKFRNIRKTGIEDAYAKGLSGISTPSQVRADVHIVNNVYRSMIDETLPKLGISKNLASGTFDRARNLGAYNLTNIAMKTGASLFITIGGWYLVTQSLRLKASNSTQDQNLRELSHRLDVMEQRRQEAYERSSR